MTAPGNIPIVGLAGFLALVLGAGATEYTIVQLHLGASGVTPLTADYDGDGKADPTVYHESGNWYFAMSSQGYPIVNFPLGNAECTPVAGDFDADGKADPTVYHHPSGNWYTALSSTGYEVGYYPAFGGPAYNPMPADYDGNGETEMAVYAPLSGDWYLLRPYEPEITDTNVLATMYSNAMVTASNVVERNIRQDLTAITEANTNLIWRTNPDTGAREVLVTSFMKTATATNYYHVGQYTLLRYGDSWVTAVPELKNVCRNYTGTNLCLRLKQVLGLPAPALNDMIVEYYLDPRVLLRPARDPEITDREAEVAFRTNTPYAASVSTNYAGWFERTIVSRNYGMTNGVWNAWPWTQLGYTYDWSKTGNNFMGLSEFVIPQEMLYNELSVTTLVYVITVTGAVNYATAPDNRFVLSQGSTITVAGPEDR